MGTHIRRFYSLNRFFFLSYSISFVHCVGSSITGLLWDLLPFASGSYRGTPTDLGVVRSDLVLKSLEKALHLHLRQRSFFYDNCILAYSNQYTVWQWKLPFDHYWITIHNYVFFDLFTSFPLSTIEVLFVFQHMLSFIMIFYVKYRTLTTSAPVSRIRH